MGLLLRACHRIGTLKTSFLKMSAYLHYSRLQKKTKWSPEEDECLRAAVELYGLDSWRRISEGLPQRSGKQCRERWIGQLAPSVSRDAWTAEEDAILRRSHAANGNRWTVIAMQLPGRSGLQVKNRWAWLMRREAPRRRSLAIDYAPMKPDAAMDVVEKRPPHRILEPISLDDGLFGAAFQEFQARMFMN
jgi:hypothetical protein